jgi:hypothetical protein
MGNFTARVTFLNSCYRFAAYAASKAALNQMLRVDLLSPEWLSCINEGNAAYGS